MANEPNDTKTAGSTASTTPTPTPTKLPDVAPAAPTPTPAKKTVKGAGGPANTGGPSPLGKGNTKGKEEQKQVPKSMIEMGMEMQELGEKIGANLGGLAESMKKTSNASNAKGAAPGAPDVNAPSKGTSPGDQTKAASGKTAVNPMTAAQTVAGKTAGAPLKSSSAAAHMGHLHDSPQPKPSTGAGAESYDAATKQNKGSEAASSNEPSSPSDDSKSNMTPGG